MARGSTSTGIWKNDSVQVRQLPTFKTTPDLAHFCPLLHVQDVAESVGILNLPEEVATALAGDVEYRLWEIIEVHPPSPQACYYRKALITMIPYQRRNQSNS